MGVCVWTNNRGLNFETISFTLKSFMTLSLKFMLVKLKKTGGNYQKKNQIKTYENHNKMIKA